MTVEEVIGAVGYLIARYLHIVCSCLIVGGTLFYEMVVPIAVGDMPEGQQLAVMGRSRWVFRWIVWVSGTLLLVSGIFSTMRHWQQYSEQMQDEAEVTVIDSAEVATTQPAAATPGPVTAQPAAVKGTKFKLRASWWWVAHASTGFMAVFIAFSLTWGRTPPAHPVQWMRLNLIILMTVIFLGSVARQVRLAVSDKQAAQAAASMGHPYINLNAEHEDDR